MWTLQKLRGYTITTITALAPDTNIVVVLKCTHTLQYGWMVLCWKYLEEPCCLDPRLTSALCDNTSWRYDGRARTAHDTGVRESICLQCKSNGVEPVLLSRISCAEIPHVQCVFLPQLPLCAGSGCPGWNASISGTMEGVAEPAEDSSRRKLRKRFQTSCRVARAAARMASHENTARMALSSFENDTEQSSMPWSEVNNPLHILMNGWRGIRGSGRWFRKS